MIVCRASVRVAVSEAVKVIRHRDTEKTGDMRSGSLHTQQAAEGYSLRSCQHHELSHRLYTHRRRIQVSGTATCISQKA